MAANMSLFFVFTVDGDWEEYYDPSLTEEKRKPVKESLVRWVRCEIRIARSLLKGKFVHFVHSSPRVRDFFLQPDFIGLWKEVEQGGGSVGVHCHEEDPRREYYYSDPSRMDLAITFMAKALKDAGLKAVCYRGGYMAFSPLIIPVLEKNGITLDFSCEPGRYLLHEGIEISDWRGAPQNFYRMDALDHKKKGSSAVYEIPVGTSGTAHLYLERISILEAFKVARALSGSKDLQIVSVLSHSYQFGSFLQKLKMIVVFLILRKYGTFINCEEAISLIKETEK